MCTSAVMAYIHKGVPVSNNFTEIAAPPPPPTPFSQSFVLTDPSGAKAEYVFVRAIEE